MLAKSAMMFYYMKLLRDGVHSKFAHEYKGYDETTWETYLDGWREVATKQKFVESYDLWEHDVKGGLGEEGVKLKNSFAFYRAWHRFVSSTLLGGSKLRSSIVKKGIDMVVDREVRLKGESRARLSNGPGEPDTWVQNLLAEFAAGSGTFSEKALPYDLEYRARIGWIFAKEIGREK
jgi:hypothetical protein